mgnify:FL=1
MPDNQKSEIVLYEAPNGQTKIDVLIEGETVWLNQSQISVLFERDRTVVTKHAGNVFSEGELEEKSNVQKMHIANSDKPGTFYGPPQTTIPPQPPPHTTKTKPKAAPTQPLVGMVSISIFQFFQTRRSWTQVYRSGVIDIGYRISDESLLVYHRLGLVCAAT